MTEDQTDDPRPGDEPAASHDDDSLFDMVVPENLKRRIEAGVDSVLKDRRVKNFVAEFKLPRELVTHAKAQMDDTKRAAVEVIARETRLFLEQTNMADELAKLLTQVSLQVDVRFIPNDKAIKSKKDGDPDKKSGLFARFRSTPPPKSDEKTESAGEETEATEATEEKKDSGE